MGAPILLDSVAHSNVKLIRRLHRLRRFDWLSFEIVWLRPKLRNYSVTKWVRNWSERSLKDPQTGHLGDSRNSKGRCVLENTWTTPKLSFWGFLFLCKAISWIVSSASRKTTIHETHNSTRNLISNVVLLLIVLRATPVCGLSLPATTLSLHH